MYRRRRDDEAALSPRGEQEEAWQLHSRKLRDEPRCKWITKDEQDGPEPDRRIVKRCYFSTNKRCP